MISTMYTVLSPSNQWNIELLHKMIDNIYHERKKYEKYDHLPDVYAAIGGRLSTPASKISKLICVVVEECQKRTNQAVKIEAPQDLFRVISKFIKLSSKEDDPRRKYCEQLDTEPKPTKSHAAVSKSAKRPQTPFRPSVSTQQRSGYRKILPRVDVPRPPPLPKASSSTSVIQNIHQQNTNESSLVGLLLLNDTASTSVSESCKTILDMVEESRDMNPFTHSDLDDARAGSGTKGPGSKSGSKHHARMENDGSQPLAKIPRQGTAAGDPDSRTDGETPVSDYCEWSPELMETVLQDMVTNQNKYKSYTLLQVCQEISQKLKIPVNRISAFIQIMATKYKQRHRVDNAVEHIGQRAQLNPGFTATVQGESLSASADGQRGDVPARLQNSFENETMPTSSLHTSTSPANVANAVQVFVKDKQTPPSSLLALPLPNPGEPVELLVKDEPPMSPSNIKSLISPVTNVTDTVESLVKEEPTSPNSLQPMVPWSFESESSSTHQSSSPSSLPSQPLLSTDQSTPLTTCGHSKSQLPVISPSKSSGATDHSQMTYTRDLLNSLASECARMAKLLPKSTTPPVRKTLTAKTEESESFSDLLYIIEVISLQLTELAKLASSACVQGTPSAIVSRTNNEQQVLHSTETHPQGASAMLNEQRTTLTLGQPQNQHNNLPQLPFKFSGQNASQDLQASKGLSAYERRYLETMNMRTEILAGIWNELKILRRDLRLACPCLQSTTTLTSTPKPKNNLSK